MKLKGIVCILVIGLFLGCENPLQVKKPSTAEDEGTKAPSREIQAMQIGVDKSVRFKEGRISPKSIESIEGSEGLKPKAFQPFYVFSDKGSRENHYIPSGFMGSVSCIKLNDTWQEKCQSGRTCIKIDYDVECSNESQKWAGIFWLNPANNWGQRKGGFDLTGAQKLIFWAKGELGGEQIEEFGSGGISGNYPDTDTAVIGPVILSNQWKEYTVDLRGKNLSHISGGFSWSTNDEVNPESFSFYLDNIRYE